ncbi:unnamed protein product [Diamesa serratosioi]
MNSYRFKNDLKHADNDKQVVVYDQFSNYSSFDDERVSSTSGSLKWSRDADNQNNKNDWELIEKIFYGEEKLPEDESTRKEFLEWMQAFPHLRVIGKQLNLTSSMNTSSNTQFEEIFAIDPPVARSRIDSFMLLEHELNEKLSIRRSQQNVSYQLKNNDIEKYLRITSSGNLQSQQQQQKSASITKKLNDQTTSYIINPINVGDNRKLSRIQEYKRFDFDKSTNQNLIISAVSPRILNIKFLLSKPDEIVCAQKPCYTKINSATSKLLPAPYYDGMGLKIKKKDNSALSSSKSASMHKSKFHHVLPMPSLNYDFVVGRSISAVSKNLRKNI